MKILIIHNEGYLNNIDFFSGNRSPIFLNNKKFIDLSFVMEHFFRP